MRRSCSPTFGGDPSGPRSRARGPSRAVWVKSIDPLDARGAPSLLSLFPFPCDWACRLSAGPFCDVCAVSVICRFVLNGQIPFRNRSHLDGLGSAGGVSSSFDAGRLRAPDSGSDELRLADGLQPSSGSVPCALASAAINAKQNASNTRFLRITRSQPLLIDRPRLNPKSTAARMAGSRMASKTSRSHETLSNHRIAPTADLNESVQVRDCADTNDGSNSADFSVLRLTGCEHSWAGERWRRRIDAPLAAAVG